MCCVYRAILAVHCESRLTGLSHVLHACWCVPYAKSPVLPACKSGLSPCDVGTDGLRCMDKILQVVSIIFVDLEPYKQHGFVNCMHACALVIVKSTHASSELMHPHSPCIHSPCTCVYAHSHTPCRYIHNHNITPSVQIAVFGTSGIQSGFENVPKF